MATVEDVRGQVVDLGGTQFGGRALYSEHVLAAFSVGGTPQERWVTVEGSPKSLDEVTMDQRLWKGKQYTIRWNPVNPDQLAIDLH